MNTFIGGSASFGIYNELIRLPLAIYLWKKDEYMPVLAVSWELKPEDKPKYFIVHLRKDAKWSDGTDFTAEDVVTTYYIGYILGWPEWEYIDKVWAHDKYTVIFHLKKPSPIIIRYILRRDPRDSKTYGKFADEILKRIKEGKTTKEMKDILAELKKYRPETILATGPFMLDLKSYTEDEVHLVKNPYFYDKDRIKFDRIKIVNGETAFIIPMILEKKIDYATHAFPPSVEKMFIEKGIRIIRSPTCVGPALILNHDVYPFNLKRFRQALAYAINRAECGKESLGKSGVPVKYMAGISDSLISRWLNKSELEGLNKYEYDPTLAEIMLEELGFTKDEEGFWIDDRGNPLEFTILAPSEWVDWFATAENVAKQLTKFGIKVTVEDIPANVMLSRIYKGNFQMAIQLWGSGKPHPYFAMWNDFIRLNNDIYRGGAGKNKGINFPLTIETDDFGKIDIFREIMNLKAGFDEEQIRKRTLKLVRIFNEYLPLIPLWERYGNNTVLEGVRVKGWPPDDDPLYRNNFYLDNYVIIMILKGILQPVN